MPTGELQAQEDASARDRVKALRDRFYIRLGTYAVGYNDATLSISSERVIGVSLDLNEDLDMDDPGQSARIDGYYRFTTRHALGFSYYAFNQEGSIQARRDIELPDPDDPDGSITIPVGAELDSSLDTNILKVNYIWSFYRAERASMFLNAGLHIADIDASIAGELVAGEPVSVESVDAGIIAPLPVLGFGFSYDPMPRMRLFYEHNAFFLTYDKYEGSFLDSSILLEYQFWKFGGVGGGINYNALNLKAKDDNSNRRLDLQFDIGALQLYLFFRHQ